MSSQTLSRKFWPKTPLDLHDVAELREHMQPLNGIPNTTNMHFVWQWSLRLYSGKPYKTRLININIKRPNGFLIFLLLSVKAVTSIS